MGYWALKTTFSIAGYINLNLTGNWALKTHNVIDCWAHKYHTSMVARHINQYYQPLGT